MNINIEIASRQVLEARKEEIFQEVLESKKLSKKRFSELALEFCKIESRLAELGN